MPVITQSNEVEIGFTLLYQLWTFKQLVSLQPSPPVNQLPVFCPRTQKQLTAKYGVRGIPTSLVCNVRSCWRVGLLQPQNFAHLKWI